VPGRDDCGQPVDGGCVLTAPVSVPPLAAVAVTGRSPGHARAEPARLSNDKIVVELGEDGLVASVTDRETGWNCLRGPGNRLRVFLDRSHFWDAWELAPGYADMPMEDLRLDRSVVLEPGPHRAAIRLRWSFRSSSVQQDIRLWSGSRRLDFVTTIDWHERRTVLRATFPLAGDPGYAVRECAFGVVPAEVDPTPEYQQARFEVPAHRFVDVGDGDRGVALLNNGRYGHSISGAEFGITLLRSPVFPDPTADEGTHTFTYSLLPHRGDWVSGGVLAEAEDLNSPFPTAACTAPAGRRQWRFFGVGGGRLSLAALKAAEDNGSLIMRVYNPGDTAAPLAVTPPPGWRIGPSVDLLEEPCGSVPGELGPFQISSFRLDRET
jgi:alpha-mannosidase